MKQIYVPIVLLIMWAIAYVVASMGLVHPAFHVNIGWIGGYICGGIFLFSK